MARLDAPWDKARILGMKGKLDFYYWKGIPVVRSWPRYTPSHFSPRSRAQWPKFAAVSSTYRLIMQPEVDFLIAMSDASQQTSRDMYTALNYGKVITFEYA